jgi:formaldehyde-activating enzyme involved in methanogenesis
LVTESGCDGAQYVAVTCIRQDFAIHGHYVSCVSHAAADAVSAGLMGKDEKGRFVREAAKKE